MSATSTVSRTLHHHTRRMAGRDPHEPHRGATPLELLFDLMFVVSFGRAASQLAHTLAEGHYAAALISFGLAGFSICWAWVNFSWFASAYDPDDWLFRLITMVQMIGVLVLALGLPRMFASIEHGGHLDNSVMVLGYVIMRLCMVFQWLRAAKQDPPRCRPCITYASTISVAQIGWVALISLNFSLSVTLIFSCALVLIELAGPIIAEHMDGGTPWHAHHIVERHGLFAMIALGEGVVGTLATLSAVIEEQGWTVDAALVCVAGIGLTFGMWWVYYILPSAPILHGSRRRAFVWGYGQMVIVASIVATGAGLHTAAYFIEHKAQIDALATVLSVVVPVSVFLGSIYALYTYLVGRFDPFHTWLLIGTAGVVALAVIVAFTGIDMAICLIILMFAPVVTIVGYEVLGHRHQAGVLARDSIDTSAVHPHV